MIHQKLKYHRDQGHVEDERHHKIIEDDMDLDRVIVIFGSYLKHMVTMDLEPITSLAGEGEEGVREEDEELPEVAEEGREDG